MKLIILGAGGLGRECAGYINDINKISHQYELLGFIDDDLTKKGVIYNGYPVLGDTNFLLELSKNEKIFTFCAIANPHIKKKVKAQLENINTTPINIIHPTAYISPDLKVGKNVLIAPLCVLTTNIKIGNYVHINPSCGIGHDCTLNDFITLYWNVNLSGNVTIEEGCQLGSKSFVRQELKLGKNVFVSAGGVVVKNVDENKTVMGVPAK